MKLWKPVRSPRRDYHFQHLGESKHTPGLESQRSRKQASIRAVTTLEGCKEGRLAILLKQVCSLTQEHITSIPRLESLAPRLFPDWIPLPRCFWIAVHGSSAGLRPMTLQKTLPRSLFLYFTLFIHVVCIWNQAVYSLLAKLFSL